jgi:hypothetical protein
VGRKRPSKRKGQASRRGSLGLASGSHVNGPQEPGHLLPLHRPGGRRKAAADHRYPLLLTNHVMLDLVLTRPHERQLFEAAGRLRSFMLDELHTYRPARPVDNPAPAVQHPKTAGSCPNEWSHLTCQVWVYSPPGIMTNPSEREPPSGMLPLQASGKRLCRATPDMCLTHVWVLYAARSPYPFNRAMPV